MNECICKMRPSNYPSDVDPYTRIVNPDCDVHGRHAQARHWRARLEQIEQERLTWAMACECYCPACKKLDRLIRGVVEDAT